MNFNFNSNEQGLDNEYELFRDTTDELINLYGVPVTYIEASKMNQDAIFGEYSHIKTNKDNHNIFVMPEDPTTWGGEGDIFSKMGWSNMDSSVIFISRKNMETIHPDLVNRIDGTLNMDELPLGNLLTFESGKIMEVTDFKLHSISKNNIFTSKREKNVYRLVLKSYVYNRDENEHDTNIIGQEDYESFGNLESIFGSEDGDIDGKGLENKFNRTLEEQGHEVQDEPIYPNEPRKKPVIPKTNNPFGDLG